MSTKGESAITIKAGSSTSYLFAMCTQVVCEMQCTTTEGRKLSPYAKYPNLNTTTTLIRKIKSLLE